MASGRQIQKKGQSNSTPTSATGMFKPRPFAIPAEPEAVTAPELQTKAEPGQVGGSRLSRIDVSAPPPIQPKLTIGAPDDKYEQEADTIARKVVKQISAPTPPDANGGGDAGQRQMFSTPSIMRLTVQRREAVEGGAASSDLESTISQARSSGRAIGEPIRRQMEGAFGSDFSGVRVHTNNTADTLNRSLSARAFTTGNNIFFKQGEYNLSSSSGKELLAHELTHVVQQNGSSGKKIVQNKAFIQRYSTESQGENFDEKTFFDIIKWLENKSNSKEKVGSLDTKKMLAAFTGLTREEQKSILQNINGGLPPKSLENFKPKLKRGSEINWSLLTYASQNTGNAQDSLKEIELSDELFEQTITWLANKAASQNEMLLYEDFRARSKRQQKEIIITLSTTGGVVFKGENHNSGNKISVLNFNQIKQGFKGTVNGEDVNWNLLRYRLNTGLQENSQSDNIDTNLLDRKTCQDFKKWLKSKADTQEYQSLFQHFEMLSDRQQESVLLYITGGALKKGIEAAKSAAKSGVISWIGSKIGKSAGMNVDWDKFSRAIIQVKQARSEETQLFGGRVAGGLGLAEGTSTYSGKVKNMVEEASGLEALGNQNLNSQSQSMGLATLAGNVHTFSDAVSGSQLSTPFGVVNNLRNVSIYNDRSKAADSLKSSDNSDLAGAAHVGQQFQNIKRTGAALDAVKGTVSLVATGAGLPLLGYASHVITLGKMIFSAWKTSQTKEGVVDAVLKINEKFKSLSHSEKHHLLRIYLKRTWISCRKYTLQQLDQEIQSCLNIDPGFFSYHEGSMKEVFMDLSLQEVGFATINQFYEIYVKDLAIKLHEMAVKEKGSEQVQQEAKQLLSNVMGLNVNPQKNLPNHIAIAKEFGW
ncbi:DUF4157 domain-containing protein [Laspinema sp. D1]|uniref:eCIS core domain-containing protein n=1 Tax=Laspinema palackyanum TaxID=3231601 RepID=UPI003476C7D9|nr:DUF4157 domain-containing protein [Laspinema sp. D2b]